MFDRQESLPDHDLAVALTDADSHKENGEGGWCPIAVNQHPLLASFLWKGACQAMGSLNADGLSEGVLDQIRRLFRNHHHG